MSLGGGLIDLRQRRLAAFVLVVLMFLLLGLGGRLVYINSVMRPRLVNLARQQQEGSTVIPARRGMILDGRGRVAAVSRRMSDVFIDPAQATDLNTLVHELAVRLNESPDALLAAVRRRPNSRYVVVASRVDETTEEAIRALKNPAVGLADTPVRTFPLGESLAHVTGWTGRDGHGMEGIELAYEKHLAGRDGQRSTIRDSRRRALWRAEDGFTPPADGGHVVLTIDAEIQRIVNEALAEGIRNFEAESGVGVVMSPTTGEVFAMACVPSFDPHDPSKVDAEVRRNRVVTDPVEPGSTIKGFIACGALEGKHLSPHELIDCHMGTYHTGSRTITDVHPYGMMNLAGIITKSSNIGMTIVGERMGKHALHDTLRRFGFGTRAGIECPGEDAGLVYPVRHWSSLTAQSVSFGYEVTMTPLQLAAAFSAIVNDGVLIKPRVVKQLLGPEGDVLAAFDSPTVVRRSVSSSVARYLADEVLVSVVEEGTGHEAKIEGYRVLGKTGTAKLTYKDRKGYEPRAYLSTFIGAAPARAPEVVVLVMIRRPNPDIGYYGGTVSAPSVRRILAETLAYLQVPPEESVAMVGAPAQTAPP
ncbi:MAG: penicillin-binding protein 2 [Planctomycetes bacterium]|nr:penicillin-binding protein 2 [Planctomycetota bacterium]